MLFKVSSDKFGTWNKYLATGAMTALGRYRTELRATGGVYGEIPERHDTRSVRRRTARERAIVGSRSERGALESDWYLQSGRRRYGYEPRRSGPLTG